MSSPGSNERHLSAINGPVLEHEGLGGIPVSTGDCKIGLQLNFDTSVCYRKSKIAQLGT